MSNFRAIATVTATLQRVLQSAVQADVSGATVTAVRPGEGASANLPTTGVNLFLYQIAQNPHRANDDLPTRGVGGEAVARPVAAVELHYLMSFYGDDLKLEPQRLLGSALAFLHAQPVLTRAQIKAAASDASRPYLAGSDLADQIDLVRLAPTGLTLDELSRLWSVFLQTHYVLSSTFKASTVLLERPIGTRAVLPVRELRLVGTPLRRPFIAKIFAQAGEGAPITPGSAIIVEGEALAGAGPFVDIDGAPAVVSRAEETQLALTLPAGLSAGPHGLLARPGLAIPGGAARPGSPSNLAAFVLQPIITKTGAQYDVAVSNVQGSGAAPRSATVTIGVTPAVGAGQTATLELSGPNGVAYSFIAKPRAASATQLVFAVAGVAAGDYIAQLRIDGAASPVEVDANGAPIAPKGSIP